MDGHRVDSDGLIRIHDARVWSLPEYRVPLVGAAVSADTAEWVADWADGLITVGCREDETGEALRRYRDAGGRGPARLQIHLSLQPSRRQALAVAGEQWAHAMAQGVTMWDVATPEGFEEAIVPSDDALEEAVLIADDPIDLADRIAAAAQGYDHIYLHHVGQDQAGFLKRCEGELLPRLRSIL